MSRSRRIVIDCSIAQASGGEAAVHPTAKQCRDFLLEVLRICHRMVFTDAVKEEWNRHQSSFAKKWRVEMFGRKKIDQVEMEENLALHSAVEKLSAQDTNNDAARNDPACFENLKEAIEKDLHLVEAALATDHIVASLDDTVRSFLKACSPSLGMVKTIVWVNPTCMEEEVEHWLENGAPAEKQRLLIRDETED